MKKAVLLLLAILSTLLTGCSDKASTGIIGYADLPTTLFLASMIIERIMPFMVITIVLAAIVGIALYIKNRK